MAGAQFAVRRRRSPESDRHSPPGSAGIHRSALVVGAAHDPAEREADRVAAAVLERLGRMPDDADAVPGGPSADAPLRRRPPPTPTDGPPAAGPPVVGMAGGPLTADLSDRINRSRSGGAPLPDQVRTPMEQAFGAGTDFRSVRIHTGPEAAGLSRSVSARAFTTGRDIFFGAGEFAPHTDAGRQTLAHELAHTLHDGGVGRRTVRRFWEFSQAQGLNIAGKTTRISTIGDKPVWFLTDESGDEMVVKAEDTPMGLGLLASHLHLTLGAASPIHSEKLLDGDARAVARLLADPTVTADDSWAEFGAFVREQGIGLPRGMADVIDADADDKQWGRMYAAYHVDDPDTTGLLAMRKAAGLTAKARSRNNGAETTFMRQLLEDRQHMSRLGQVHVVDLFSGNSDRISGENLGNWFYDAGGEITLIDQVNKGQSTTRGFVDNQRWADDPRLGDALRSRALPQTALEAIESLLFGVEEAGDPGVRAWADEPNLAGEVRKTVMVEAFLDGMVEARKRLIKVFASTRHTIGGRNKRAIKKGVKQSSRQAREMDRNMPVFYQGDEAPDYYEVLKARAKWLAKS